jgi:hypothetical protein
VSGVARNHGAWTEQREEGAGGGQVAIARPQGAERNTNVYVANLDSALTSQGLQTLFETYGKVLEAKVLQGVGVRPGP